MVGDIVYTSCSPEKFADSFKKKEKKVFHGVVCRSPIVPQRSAPCRGKDSGTVCGARGSLPSRLTRGLIGHAFITSAGRGTKISFQLGEGHWQSLPIVLIAQSQERSAVFRIVPKPICSTSALIPFGTRGELTSDTRLHSPKT